MKWNQTVNRRTVLFSKIDFNETLRHDLATNALGVLLQNGYTVMSGYSINEIIKLIRSLKELKVEYQMRVVQASKENKLIDSVFDYYFTLPFFEDDRVN
jgi:hypothetical protein